MAKRVSTGKDDPFVLWMLLGIPILFIVAAPLHFVFDRTGGNVVAGLFTPVNESPWEHLKLAFWPILIWWVVGYLAFGRKKSGGFPLAVVSCAVCELVCLLFILGFFYTYTGVFGVQSLVLDILSLPLGLTVGVFLAVHVYKHASPGALAALLSVAVLLVLAAAFIYFTFAPPPLPLFMDPPTGSYGITM